MNKIGKIKYMLMEKIFLNKYLRFKAKISLPKIRRARYKSILPGPVSQRTRLIQKSKFKEKFSPWISFLSHGIRKIKELFTAKKELSGFKTYCSFQGHHDEIVPIIDISWSFDKNIVIRDSFAYKEDEGMRPSEHNLSERLGIYDGKILPLPQSLKPVNGAFKIPFSLIEESYYQVPPPPRAVLKSSQNFTQPMNERKSYYQNLPPASSSNLSFSHQNPLMTSVSKNSLEKLIQKKWECKRPNSKKNRRTTLS